MKAKSISRRTFIIGGGLLFVSYFFYQKESVAVTRYVIPIHNLPQSFQGFTILHVSDLHSKEYGPRQQRLLSLIQRHPFDIVAITGDLVDQDNPGSAPAIGLVQGLPQKPVFFVPGNHEWRTGYGIKEPLLAEGVQILENSRWKILRGEDHIWIIGVDDPYLDRSDLPAAMEGTADRSPRILLSHAPTIYSSAVQAGIDLVLAGHTHGGQIRLPLLGAIFVPGQGVFPSLDYGLFASESTHMVINAGLGESIVPVRFNIRPEIVLVTLTNWHM